MKTKIATLLNSLQKILTFLSQSESVGSNLAQEIHHKNRGQTKLEFEGITDIFKGFGFITNYLGFTRQETKPACNINNYCLITSVESEQTLKYEMHLFPFC